MKKLFVVLVPFCFVLGGCKLMESTLADLKHRAESAVQRVATGLSLEATDQIEAATSAAKEAASESATSPQEALIFGGGAGLAAVVAQLLLAFLSKHWTQKAK